MEFLLLIPAVFVVILIVEALIARSRPYLPLDPGYSVDVSRPGNAPAATIALLGDSMAAGLGATGPEESIGGHIATRVAKHTGREVRLIGFAISGADTRSLTRLQVPAFAQHAASFDCIIVSIGSNDVLHLTPPWRIAARTSEMLNAIAAARPGVPIVMCSAGRMSTPNFLQPLRAVIVWYATLVRRGQHRSAARAGIAFIDVRRDISPLMTGGDPAQYDGSDGFHPSSAAYAIWAQPISAAVIHELTAE